MSARTWFEAELPTEQSHALSRLLKERERQEGLKADGKFDHTPADDISNLERLAILMEEVGEVAKAIIEGDKINLYDEVTQVGAVALAWLEGFR